MNAWRWYLVLLVLVAAAGGCNGSESQGPRGAPILLKMFWRAGSERQVVWSLSTDPNLKVSVAPFAVEFDLTFQGRLDGNKIEDVIAIDGGTATRPMTMPPVSVTWPDMSALATDTFTLAVGYNSLPLPGIESGTVYVFGRATPTYPSATTLTVHLDPDRLTSVYDEPMSGPTTIDVRTEPFLVKVTEPPVCPGGSPRPVSTDFQLPLVFNNRPLSDDATVAGFIHVTANDTVVPFRLISDPSNPATLLVAPGGGGAGRWPAGMRIRVAVDGDLPDFFGVGLSAAGAGSFVTLAPENESASRCPPVSDGGAADADGSADKQDAGSDAVDDVGDDVASDVIDAELDAPG
ncbi:MAG TPA: hypothetical protein VFH73_03670 [Polyangia bacterium]|nr:hypothetical protein [Polyangia bacterium]